MRYVEIKPGSPLAEFVKCIWILEDASAAGVGPIDRVMPDGCMELIVHYGDAMNARVNGGGFDKNPKSVLAGQMSRFLELQSTGRLGMIGVRFLPGGASAFFRLSLHALADRIVGFDCLEARDLAEFEDRVCGAETDAQRLDLVTGFLLRRLSHGRYDDPMVTRSVRQILTYGGNTSVDALTAAAGISARQLERRFKSAVGILPKLLCRIVRFRRVFDVIERTARPRWAEAALACGYYDQAHLIRDFNRFAGQAPAAYLREESPIGHCLTQSAY